MIYARAYTYSTHSDARGSELACAMQRSEQWCALVSLLYRLGITVLY